MQNGTLKVARGPEPRHPAPSRHEKPKLRQADAEDVQVAVPENVDVALPKEPAHEIAVPASINGRDLSRGRP